MCYDQCERQFFSQSLGTKLLECQFVGEGGNFLSRFVPLYTYLSTSGCWVCLSVKKGRCHLLLSDVLICFCCFQYVLTIE